MKEQDTLIGVSGPDKGEESRSDEPEGELQVARRDLRDLRDALAASRARERALTLELQHRVRNMLAVIRSIYRRTRESGANQEEFAEHFEGRLDALARHQSQVDAVGSAGVEIEDMLRSELLEGQCLDTPRCTLKGPPVSLWHKSAELMGLAIHELTTNAIKFGALAHGGVLAVDWQIEKAGDASLLRFRWTETGVPIATPAPRSSGFGRQLIEEALPYQVGATTSFELKPGGIECVILLPLSEAEATIIKDDQAAETPLLAREPE